MNINIQTYEKAHNKLDQPYYNSIYNYKIYVYFVNNRLFYKIYLNQKLSKIYYK